MAKESVVWQVLEQLEAELICEMDARELQQIIFDRHGVEPPLRTIRSVRQAIMDRGNMKTARRAGKNIRLSRTKQPFGLPSCEPNQPAEGGTS